MGYLRVKNRSQICTPTQTGFFYFIIMIIHVNVYTSIDLSFSQNKKAYYYALGEIYFNLSRKNVKTEFEFLIDEKYYLATLRRVEIRRNEVSYDLIA